MQSYGKNLRDLCLNGALFGLVSCNDPCWRRNQYLFGNLPLLMHTGKGWWFQIFFIFTPTWGHDPISLIFLRWVETTNWHLFCYLGSVEYYFKVFQCFFEGQDPRELNASKRSYHFFRCANHVWNMYIYIFIYYVYIYIWNPTFLCHFGKNILCLYEKISQTTCHYPKGIIFSRKFHVESMSRNLSLIPIVWNWYKGGLY